MIYATYFDSNFLARGLACIESLFAHCRTPITVLVLALDDACAAAVRQLTREAEPFGRVEVVTLAELERRHPELESVRSGRSRIGYYFTLTPFLCAEAMRRTDEADYAVYVDADLYFSSDPQAALTPVAGAEIAIVEHRFPPRLSHLNEIFGRFNVGWIAFRKRPEAAARIAQWQSQCLEWCAELPEPGRFGDQKYLEGWAQEGGSKVKINPHPGVNLAPWNVAGHRLTVAAGGGVKVDGADLVCFHFHHLNRLGSDLYEADFRAFGRIDRVLRGAIYRPYLLALQRIEACLVAELDWRPPAASVWAMTMPKPRWRKLAAWPFRAARLFARRRVIFERGEPLSPVQGLRWV